MKSDKTNPDTKSDKIEKKIDNIFKNRAKTAQSYIGRIPKQTPAHYLVKNCRADKKSKND